MRRTPLRRRSPKRARQEREYARLRAAFLAGHPYCESPLDCGQAATEIQHRRGRRGARLIDVDWWAASCRACNEWAETNTGEALASGWLIRIEASS